MALLVGQMEFSHLRDLITTQSLLSWSRGAKRADGAEAPQRSGGRARSAREHRKRDSGSALSEGARWEGPRSTPYKGNKIKRPSTSRDGRV